MEFFVKQVGGKATSVCGRSHEDAAQRFATMAHLEHNSIIAVKGKCISIADFSDVCFFQVVADKVSVTAL